MRFISCHDGKLQTLETAGLKASPDRSFVTGLPAWNALAPQQLFARGAVHELLFDGCNGVPAFPASVLAQAASEAGGVGSHPPSSLVGEGGGEGDARGVTSRVTQNDFGAGLCESKSSRSDEHSLSQRTYATASRPGLAESGSFVEGNVVRLHAFTSHPHPHSPQGERGPDVVPFRFGNRIQEMPVIWSDPRNEIYPPALAAFGFDLTRTYLLRTTSDADEAWAVAECLRCPGVGAVIAQPPASRRMSRIEARRLQLAAEAGGSVGILLRQTGRGTDVYAAATRWHISPLAGEPTVQRWTIRLLHGHGGRVGESVILECRRERENYSVRAIEPLADRPAATPAPRATA